MSKLQVFLLLALVIMMMAMVAMAWKDPNKDSDGDGLMYVDFCYLPSKAWFGWVLLNKTHQDTTNDGPPKHISQISLQFKV